MKPKRNQRQMIWMSCVSMFVVTVVFTTAQDAQAQWAGTTNIYNTNSGNVGIGTNNPAQKLEVNGIVRQGVSNGISLGADGGRNRIVGSASAPEFQFLNASDAYANLGMRGASIGINYASVAPPTNGLILEGNVGIGTTTPGYKLDVSGAANITGNIFLPTASTGLVWGNASSHNYIYGDDASNYIRFVTNNSHSLVIASGNVGIGTTTPGYKLDVSGAANITGNIFLPTATSGLVWGNASSHNYIYGDDASNYIRFVTNNSQSLVIASGKVGIGTTGPNAALDVVGDIHLTGTINARYQDVAEWVPSSEQLAAGTVVVLDSTKSNQVTSSSVSYDTRVAGVISEQPGLALGEKTDNKVLVATTGRVKVKVDASKSPIHIGDLLVTSDMAGTAMKSKEINLGGVKIHRPGTLIGKALEPLERGSGEILVLLSLQ